MTQFTEEQIAQFHRQSNHCPVCGSRELSKIDKPKPSKDQIICCNGCGSIYPRKAWESYINWNVGLQRIPAITEKQFDALYVEPNFGEESEK